MKMKLNKAHGKKAEQLFGIYKSLAALKAATGNRV